MRLQRFMAQAGVSSRRKAEELIAAGQVRVNGKVVTELGSKIEPGVDRVEVDGRPVGVEERVYLVLNKPKGYVTTVADPEGRQTVMELLPQDLPARVVPVGRLDFYTEGVLLFTNDGDLQAALLHPRHHVEKTYHAKMRGHVTDAQITRLRAGVRIEDNQGRSVKTQPAKVDRLSDTGTHDWLVISIAEGRSRQIHRMAEAVGLTVTKLARVSFAGVTYEGLKIGECRYLEPLEVKELYTIAGLGSVKVPQPPRLTVAAKPYVPKRPHPATRAPARKKSAPPKGRAQRPKGPQRRAR